MTVRIARLHTIGDQAVSSTLAVASTFAELERLEQTRPPAEHPAGAMALVGLWHDVPDEEIEALVTDLRATRDRDTGRPVELEA
jgi:hypothetical protein